MKTTYIISRAINGITINGDEYVLNDNGVLMEFISKEKARNFMLINGIKDGYSIDVK